MVFDALSKKEQDVVMALGQEMEEFGTKEAMADDQKVSEVYSKKGLQVADLNDATVEKWRAIARKPLCTTVSCWRSRRMPTRRGPSW